MIFAFRLLFSSFLLLLLLFLLLLLLLLFFEPLGLKAGGPNKEDESGARNTAICHSVVKNSKEIA